MNCHLLLYYVCLSTAGGPVDSAAELLRERPTEWWVAVWAGPVRNGVTLLVVKWAGLVWSPSVVLCVSVLYSLAGYSETSDDGTNQLNWGF